MTDADLLLLEIKTKDVYKDFSNDIEKYFDTSNYIREFYNETKIPKKSKKVLGKIKDELGGK